MLSRPGVEPRSLRRNFGAASIGNVVYAASQFGMLLSLARFTSVADVGRYALALAIAGPVFILTGLKLRQAQVTDAGAEYVFGQYLALRLASSLVGCIAVVAIAGAFSFPPISVRVIIAIAVFKAFESVIDICYGAMQQREQLHLVARSMAIRGVSGLSAFAGALVLTHRVDVAVVALTALTLWQLGVAVWRVRSLGVPIKPVFDRDILMLARQALPLGVSVSIGSLSVNVPRYLIGFYKNTSAIGIYAAMSYPLVATATIAGALVESATPRLSKLYYAGDANRFRSTMYKLVFLGATLGLSGIITAAIAGKILLRVAFGSQYADASNVLVLLMVAATLQYTTVFLGTAVNAMRLFTVQAPISLAGLVTVFLVGVMVVPHIGLYGAALAVIAGQVIEGTCYLVLLRRVILPRLTELSAP